PAKTELRNLPERIWSDAYRITSEMAMHRLSRLILIAPLFLVACATTTQQEPQIQRISPEELEQIMPKPVPNVTLDEIVELSKQGNTSDRIINKIKATNSRYEL